MKRSVFQLAALALAAVLAGCGGADPDREAAAPSAAGGRMDALALKGDAVVSNAKIDRRLAKASGTVQVWVSFDQNSLARTRALMAGSAGMERQRALAKPGGDGAANAESAGVRAAMSAQRSTILAQQAEAAGRLASLGATELARVKVAHNAIAVRVDAAQLASIAAMPGVARVRPVIDYQLHLGETVPYVGGAAVQSAGFDGTGVRVAVLDSGIDYTHKNLGGPGTTAAYDDCYLQKNAAPTGPCAALFGPGAPKVVGGYDFVGEVWPSGALQPDPNPIDLEGHGTHVADIIAGKSADGTHKGMAPGAKLLAVKVCSAVSSSCSGVALLQGVDFALDPNDDGNVSDAVDVMNLSLGSDYGQIEDDLTFALSNAVDLGVVVVASAGNGGDRPYKVGTPSIAPGVISVAQTQVPSATAVPLVVNSPPPIAGTYGNTATLDFAPVGNTDTSGEVKTALQAGGADNRACAALPAGSLAGKIALIDRGSCAISLKVDAAAKAGAKGVLIALVAAGDAQGFSFGGGTSFVPTLVIQQSLGNAIKAQLSAPVNVTIKATAPISLIGGMAGSSSRGPSSIQGIKPEIGAPGASLSAEVGTGDGQIAFGGTSGAAPMVAGAAALMVQAHPARSALQIKAMLMNSAETAVYTNPAALPGQLAPISRIGAGELRVNRAFALRSAAWNQDAQSAALAFGAQEVAFLTTVSRKLTVENFGNRAKRFAVSSSFRFADDQASGAVKVLAPSQVTVPAGGSAEITVTLVIDPNKLPTWTLDGGAQGGNGAALTGPEYDGYLELRAGNERLSVPWHVLPRKAALAGAVPIRDRSGSALLLSNLGVESGDFDLFSLTGVSPKLPKSELPGPGDNFAVIDLKSVGVRYLAESDCGVAGGCLQFAISTFGRRPHPLYPRGLEVDINTGTGVYAVYQDEAGGFGASGQSLVFVQKVGTTTASAFFYNDADLNSGNSIFTVPLALLGNPSTSTTLTFDVFAYDNYFTGFVSDSIEGMKFTPASPRFTYTDSFGSVPRFTLKRVPYTANAAVTAAQSTESGLLLMYRRNALFEDEAITLPR